MKYQHASITVEQPAPGHYSVNGLPANSYYKEGEGHIVAPNTLYVGPNVPDELLETILADRKAQRKHDGGTVVVEKEKAVVTDADVKKGKATPADVDPNAPDVVLDPNQPVSFSQAEEPVRVDIRDRTARETEVNSLGKKEKRKYTRKAKGAH
jgi:hypothetical protein